MGGHCLPASPAAKWALRGAQARLVTRAPPDTGLAHAPPRRGRRRRHLLQGRCLCDCWAAGARGGTVRPSLPAPTPHVAIPTGHPAGRNHTGACPGAHAPSCLCVSTAVRLPMSTLTGLYRSSPPREGESGDLPSPNPASPPRSSAATSGDASCCVASCAMAALDSTAGWSAQNESTLGESQPSPRLPPSGRRTAATDATHGTGEARAHWYGMAIRASRRRTSTAIVQFLVTAPFNTEYNTCRVTCRAVRRCTSRPSRM